MHDTLVFDVNYPLTSARFYCAISVVCTLTLRLPCLVNKYYIQRNQNNNDIQLAMPDKQDLTAAHE